MQNTIAKLGLLLFIGFWSVGCSITPSVNSESVAPKIERDATTIPQGQSLPVSAQVVVGGVTIVLEVAKTPQQQAIGLMHRQSLPKDRGMLFIFEPPQPVRFWMKNVNFPLDMIFIKEGRIKSIRSQVPLCSADPCPTYGPAMEVDSVIELPGGQAQSLGISQGDRLSVEWLKHP